MVVPQLSLTHPLPPIFRTGISSFFTDLVPDYFSAALMGAGGAMLLVALVGCCSCGCCQVRLARPYAARVCLCCSCGYTCHGYTCNGYIMAIPWLYQGSARKATIRLLYSHYGYTLL